MTVADIEIDNSESPVFTEIFFPRINLKESKLLVDKISVTDV